MPADLPYERDVDREHAEQHRARAQRAERRVEIKNELHRVAGLRPGARREAGSPPLTERVTALFAVGELERLQRAADELGVSVRSLVRGGALLLARRLEGRP